MGLFGKKNNKESTPSAPSDNNSSNNTAKKKKRDDDLARVISESVWERALEDFKANKNFYTKNADGETVYVGLLFDTNQVGGLAGKNAKHDESKGSIIEAITTGRIKTYSRLEMLYDGCILIIPDRETIENMDEFNILANSEYSICVVDVDGNMIALTADGTDDGPELTVKFSSVRDCVLNDGTYDDLKTAAYAGSVYSGDNTTGAAIPVIPESASNPISNIGSDSDPIEDDPFASVFSDNDDAETLPDDMDEDSDHFTDSYSSLEDSFDADLSVDSENLTDAFSSSNNDDDFGDLANDNSYGSDMPGETTMASPSDDGADSNVLGYDESPDDEAEPMTYYQDVTAEFMNNYTVHKFYSDDLGLEVSTQPFDTKFLHANPYIPFNENRGEGWLNEYLSNFSRDANVRMERLHNENLYRLRDKYMRIIRSNCEAIARNLDSQDINNQYGRMKDAITHLRNDNMERLPQLIEERRNLLDKEWNAEIERIGEDAAANAKKAYIERTRATHDRAIEDIEHDARDEIDREYENGIRRMNEDRRAEAGKLLDLAIGEALKEMDALYEKVLASEQKEYLRLQNEMSRFIDDNRKDEKARIEVLAEENRQVKRANEVRKEFLAKMKIMNAEFDAKKSALQADIDRMNREHDEEIRNYESEWSSKLSDEKARSADLEARIDDLLKQYADLDEKKTREFEARLNELKSENEAKDASIEHIVASHKRSNLISIFLIVAILIAAIGIGFMIGSLVNIRNASAIEQDIVHQSYQSESDNSDSKTDILISGSGHTISTGQTSD